MFENLFEKICNLNEYYILVSNYCFFELPQLISFLIVVVIYVLWTIFLNVVKVETLQTLVKRLCLIIFYLVVCYSFSILFKQPMVISWLKPSLQYFFTDPQNPIITILILFEVSQVFLLVVSIFYFSLIHGVNADFINLLKKWLVLPFFTKYKLACFTVTFAIPNKVIVHNSMPIVLWLFLNAFYLAVSYSFPLLLLLYINMWFLILTSFVTGVFYHFDWFKHSLTRLMFNSDSLFAEEYITFFMGNAARSAWRRGAYFAGTVALNGATVKTTYYQEKDYAERLGRQRSAKDFEDQKLRGEPIYTNRTEDFHYNNILKEQPLHHGLEVAKEVATSASALVADAFKSL